MSGFTSGEIDQSVNLPLIKMSIDFLFERMTFRS